MNHKYIAVVGMFDGVHLGHRYLLGRLAAEAAARALTPLVVTFANHPLSEIAPDRAPRLLTSPGEKRLLLSALGLEVEMLPFTPQLRGLTARQFLEQLRSRGVEAMLMGFDNRFGSDAPAGGEEYRRMGRECGVEIVGVDEFVPAGAAKASSSAVRALLTQGQIEDANRLLGRPYRLSGKVVHGLHNGTRLGFPTANLEPDDPAKLIPANGAYAGVAEVGGRRYRAMVNIGYHPTVGASELPVVEAHLLDFEGDIYGQPITLDFTRRLRPERRFASEDQLRAQLAKDRAAVEAGA